MNPLAVLGIAAGVVGVAAIAGQKRNTAAEWLATYWRRVQAGEDPAAVVQAMLGSPGNLPDGFIGSQASWIVARGRPGRDMDMDDDYQGRADPHWGKDITAAAGTEVYAAKSGIVTYCENRIAGFGRMIWLSHLDEPMSTVYAHLDGFNCGLGQLVQGGNCIGFVGNTCAPEGVTPPCWCRRTSEARCIDRTGQNISRTMGAHCHFEVHTSRIPVMGTVRDNIAAGRRECLEPVTWLAQQGIEVVGELV